MFRQPRIHIPFHPLLLTEPRRRYTPLFLANEEPMPKLKKIRTEQEMWKFCSGLNGIVVVEKKLDGISCYLFYNRGQLVKATTKRGWNVMRIIGKIGSIPKQVDRFFTGGVRGELYMTKAGFEICNEERARNGLRVYKSPTAAISGLVKSNQNFQQKTIEFHGFLINGWIPLETQTGTIRKLEQLGINRWKDRFYAAFNLPKDFYALCRYVQNSQERRDEFDSYIDGLVIKANLLSEQRAEKKVVAYKYGSIDLKQSPRSLRSEINSSR